MKKIVKIEKMIERKDAQHPNNIDENEVHYGIFQKLPTVGESFNLFGIDLSRRGLRGFRTSTVIEILDDDTFMTVNSVYQIEFVE